MRVAIVYESEFGATRAVAEAIGRGAASAGAGIVGLHNVHELALAVWSPEHGDLLFVGAPTQEDDLPTAATRSADATRADRHGSSLVLEPDALMTGVREWLAQARLDGITAAAFGTQPSMSPLISGSSAQVIGRALVLAGAGVIDEQAFLVDSQSRLVTNEIERAEQWGAGVLTAALAARAAATAAPQ
ncbi:MAG: flavodoxin domain-containing protein [Pseudolysinimonas sp.]